MFQVPTLERYTNLPHSDDQEKLISETASETSSEPLISTRPRRSFSTTSTLLLVFLCGVAGSLAGLLLGRQIPGDLDAVCTAHTSKYSIMTEDIPITYHTQRFNGSFEKENIYRGDASPEVDAAWDALGVNFLPVIVPEGQLAEKSGLTKDHARRAKKYGGGIPVFVEGFHQLHCLNLLRKSLFYNYDYYHSKSEVEFSDPEAVQRWHVSHCLDFIRQRLMCDFDIGTFGQVWVQHPTPRPWVDFNTQHQCRNFDQIRQWADEHQVLEEPDDWWEWPSEDVKIWDHAP